MIEQRLVADTALIERPVADELRVTDEQIGEGDDVMAGDQIRRCHLVPM